MGELRNGLRAFAVEGHRPAEALRQLDRMVQATLGPGMVATVLFLILDPEAGTVTVANAGHPPPAVVGADGRVRFLDTDRCLPLGIDASAPATERVHHLAVGDTLVLFTDGLIERRDESIEFGFERLRNALRDAPGEVEALCDHVLEHALGDHPSQDDVAMLAVRLLGQLPGPLDLTLPAVADSVPVARHQLSAWLHAVPEGVDQDVRRDLELACSEACANSVRHAYGPADATFSVHAEVLNAEIVLEVVDHGSWREPRGDQGGWGLHVIRSVCDSVQIDPRRDGTTVRMRRGLRAKLVSSTPSANGASSG
jgi:anti-sigma regulatory factor (Ser/Thr protein kinase)